MIEIKNLNKYYSKGRSNEVHAVNDVSLTLPDSGMVAIFGKSGCGKTTLLNVIGGLELDEPAADIAIALALISSLTDRVIPDDLIAIGEIGLSGECRGVANVSQRVKEASRLGFTKAVIPVRNYERDKFDCNIELIPVKNIYDLLKVIRSQPEQKK
jgi:predicted ATP-dependent protease